MRTSLAAALAAALLVLTGCGPHTSGGSGAGGSDVVVDSPSLQQLKADAGIATCAPGTGSSASLPDLTLPCLGGGPAVDLAGLTGPLVINLWNSPCRECRQELPALQAFYERYGTRVPVLGIDWVDTYPAAALDLLHRSGATYPQLADPGGELLDQRTLPLTQGIPQFILVDAAGKVAWQGAGGLKDVDEVARMVEQHLGLTL